MYLFAILLPGYVSVGHIHLPVYGMFAAFGLLLVFWLSQRTAVLAGIPPENLWDAGMVAVLAAFIASRVLLIVASPKAFLRYPLLVLSLPSLTYSGLFLTGLLVWLWLRWKQLPVLSVADAWAPCGALLWAVLSIGHFVEGTDAGMPTRLPWGVITTGDSVLGHVHPVQIYTAALAIILCVALMRRLQQRKKAGEVTSLGLIVAGTGSFLLGMVRQPADTFGDSWLDPAQWVALASMLAGTAMMLLPKHKQSTEQTKEPR